MAWPVFRGLSWPEQHRSHIQLRWFTTCAQVLSYISSGYIRPQSPSQSRSDFSAVKPGNACTERYKGHKAPKNRCRSISCFTTTICFCFQRRKARTVKVLQNLQGVSGRFSLGLPGFSHPAWCFAFTWILDMRAERDTHTAIKWLLSVGCGSNSAQLHQTKPNTTKRVSLTHSSQLLGQKQHYSLMCWYKRKLKISSLQTYFDIKK